MSDFGPRRKCVIEFEACAPPRRDADFFLRSPGIEGKVLTVECGGEAERSLTRFVLTAAERPFRAGTTADSRIDLADLIPRSCDEYEG